MLNTICMRIMVVVSVVLPAAAAAADDAASKLKALLKDEWEYQLKDNPTFASTLGDRRYNAQWPDVSAEAIRRRHEHDLDVLKRLDGIDADSLSKPDRMNYVLFRKGCDQGIAGHAFRSWLLAVNQMGGIHAVGNLADSLAFRGVKDYEDWITRLQALPVYVEQVTALLKEGARVGIVYPKVIMSRVPDQIASQIVEDPSASPFFKPFSQFPDGIGEADRKRLIEQAKQAIADQVVPAYRAFHKFFVEEYLPACRESVGASQLPNGKAFYAYRVRVMTTTRLTPAEIHEIGKREVERIEGQMRELLKELKHEGDLKSFIEKVRTDPNQFYTKGEDLLRDYRALCKKIDPRLTLLFGKLPRMPYGVEPVPEQTAPAAPTAYYRGPSADGLRAGYFMVNLYKPETRPKYEMVPLVLHEAMPGHHLQTAISQELGELPEFRRYGGYTAYDEGWALYAESLGYSIGVYDDPYARFGQLSLEVWRAVRLVVDTGLHQFGWTRQQAIDYCRQHLPKNELDITNEVDRYIVWPGQALAYKIGELKIRELRTKAEKQLGDRFDIRAFHDMLLSRGAVPLDVLETMVNEWASNQSTQQK